VGTAPRAAVAPQMAMPPRVGLIPSLTAMMEEDAFTGQARWGAGYAFNPEGCGSGGVLNPCGHDEKEIADNPAVIDVEPFVVWAGDKCAPWQLDRDWKGRSRRQLAATESYQVARELWRGDLASVEIDNNGDPWPNRWLASPDSDVLTDGPTSIVDAVACLEHAMGQCAKGQRGMIHVTRQAATYMATQYLVRREGNLLLTIHDTIVVPDAGYDGSGPDGQDAAEGSSWIYGTTMIQLRMSPVDTVPNDMSEATLRTTNMVEFRAERLASAAWDHCCHLAVELDMSLCDIGGPGS
jgi:hypothetical protein